MEKKEPVTNKRMLIVGINLAVLAAYTIYFRINKEELIAIAEAFFIAV
jgi:hypothetical protein